MNLADNAPNIAANGGTRRGPNILKDAIPADLIIDRRLLARIDRS
jgi:hypothetical protein